MNVREQVQVVKGQLDEVRIAKDKRTQIDYRLNDLSRALGGMPVDVESVPNPNVDPEWYSGKYYWEHRNRADARIEAPAYVSVSAVNIDYLSEHDAAERRSPSGWLPRVEVTFKANDHVLVGDLDPKDAIALATQLLAAAQLVQR